MRRQPALGSERMVFLCGVVSTLTAASCTRTIGEEELCDLVEDYETGAPLDAYLDCGGAGEDISECQEGRTGRRASTGAIEAAFAACNPSPAPHPGSSVIYSQSPCEHDSGVVLYGMGGSCEVPAAW